MKTLLKILVVLVGLLVLVAVGVYVWASLRTSGLRAETHETHSIDFPIPFPIDPEEAATLKLDEAAARRLAQERAAERGRHLVNARYACVACHGQNFGGGVMVDAFPLGSLLGPNVTTGQGSRTLNYAARDWDRIVRHGVLPDGRPAVMPSEDFQLMSDQELSDIVTYVRTLPAVDNTVPTPTFGPLGKVLVATGQLHFSAAMIPDHQKPHAERPPVAEASAQFGQHLAGVCTGCHGADFSGGPIPGGDPAWPPARNLTPDATGLAGWTFEQFDAALTQAKRPDGSAVRDPMALIAPFGQSMTDVERRALWAFLQSLPPVQKTVEGN
jgi:mono/diheme cytochrome c family protein